MRFQKSGIRRYLCASLAAVLWGMPFTVHAEPVINCWDEVKKAHYERRRISTALNVYAEEGTIPRVRHESGWIDGVEYDVLRVDPSETTFVKVDYSEQPVYLSQLKDDALLRQGYVRVGGINAGYFSNGTIQNGKPVGAVRTENEWTQWHGERNTPAYGSGYATAYFNVYGMALRYHGWKNGSWQGDHNWSYWTGYLIEAENGISGSYTYFADGCEQDITRGDYGAINYRTYGRALTVFAQRSDGQFLLLEIYGTVKEEAVRAFLRNEHVTDAIRLDGGGSCQMIYEDTLVNYPYVFLTELPPDEPVFDREAAILRRKRKPDILNILMKRS
ncbi:MAG: phosphodiester glycosidase family protein [Solobacterium sp.]|nr:phosphodiester glycosidase family protein [Solobacterium sp.]